MCWSICNFIPRRSTVKIDRANVLMELGNEDEALDLLLEIEETSQNIHKRYWC